jgi:putative ABC transport system permease protein
VDSVPTISFIGLAIGFIPAVVVVILLYRWSCNFGTTVYAMCRMVIQLLLIGYVLTFIFESSNAWITALVLSFMLMVAGWIALRPLRQREPKIYTRTLLSIALGGITTLTLVTQFIVDVDPWYAPRFVIPLAGMIFASAMNTVSLAGERLQAEQAAGTDYPTARNSAFQAALIPLVNSLLAVGLVSLPGMMTGQILAGISPLIATRYQIVIMCMLFGSSGIAAACYLFLSKYSDHLR